MAIWLHDCDISQNIYLRADLKCQSQIELPYYNVNYEDICVYCGTVDNLQVREGS